MSKNSIGRIKILKKNMQKTIRRGFSFIRNLKALNVPNLTV
jgi:hypothetical protein